MDLVGRRVTRELEFSVGNAIPHVNRVLASQGGLKRSREVAVLKVNDLSVVVAQPACGIGTGGWLPGSVEAWLDGKTRAPEIPMYGHSHVPED
jgi:hypothetical protein